MIALNFRKCYVCTSTLQHVTHLKNLMMSPNLPIVTTAIRVALGEMTALGKPFLAYKQGQSNENETQSPNPL